MAHPLPTRSRGRRPRAALAGSTLGLGLGLGLALAVALAGCTADAPGDDGSATGTPTPAATAEPAVGSLDEVRATGTGLTVGDLTVRWQVAEDAPAPAEARDEDGAATLTVTTGADGTALLIAPPDGTTAEALADGSVVLRADGVFVAGLTGVGADGGFAPVATVRADGLLAWTGDAGSSAAVTLATAAVRDATWADRDDEGGRSLQVVPTTWARTGGLAAEEGVWAQLVALEPEADSQAMHDQLTCHTIGAPDKASWNLEPWRPDVGLLATLAARCNPTA
jgi:hypothetical protein